jgi:FixJ family two-component response regulator
MTEKVVVAIIDDDESIRRSLLRMLRTAGFEVLAFASAREFLETPEHKTVSCTVSDLRMPEVSGLDLQQALRTRLPHLSMVFVTGHGDVPAAATAMKAGAVDFLEKPANGSVLFDAIGRAVERSRRLQAANAALVSLKIRYATLTPRECEVFSLVAAGLLNKQIAAELGVAEKTIKQHRGHVMEKMAAESLADLVLMAERLGVRPMGIDFSKAKGRTRSS